MLYHQGLVCNNSSFLKKTSKTCFCNENFVFHQKIDKFSNSNILGEKNPIATNPRHKAHEFSKFTTHILKFEIFNLRLLDANFYFLHSILCLSYIGNHFQEELAKFGYKSKKKSRIFKSHAIFW